MEEADKDWMMIRMVGRWMFLLVPAHPGSLGKRAVKRLLLYRCVFSLSTPTVHNLYRNYELAVGHYYFADTSTINNTIIISTEIKAHKVKWQNVSTTDERATRRTGHSRKPRKFWPTPTTEKFLPGRQDDAVSHKSNDGKDTTVDTWSPTRI